VDKFFIYIAIFAVFTAKNSNIRNYLTLLPAGPKKKITDF
jgi:hypothetical protein